MADALVANITALLGSAVSAIVLRHMHQNESSGFRWIPSVAALIVAAVVLQYMILIAHRPSNRAETAEVAESVDGVSEAVDELSEAIDELEYRMARAPLPDSAEFHFPSWDYYYNDGDPYVEGHSHVELIRNMPVYQYKVLVKCSDPDTLHLMLSEGYFDYTFSTEHSPRGNVTRIFAYLDNEILILDNDKVRVVDGTAIITVDNIAARLSEGVLLILSLRARVESLGWDSIHHDTIFVLRYFRMTWRECPE